MHKLKGYLISILISILIVHLSLMPTDPEKHQRLFDIHGLDKIIHFIMYCSLMLSLLRDHFRLHIFKKKLIFYLATLVYAISIGVELIQHFFTTDRSGEILDAAANFTGVLTGIIIYLLLKDRIGFFKSLDQKRD